MSKTKHDRQDVSKLKDKLNNEYDLLPKLVRKQFSHLVANGSKENEVQDAMILFILLQQQVLESERVVPSTIPVTLQQEELFRMCERSINSPRLLFVSSRLARLDRLLRFWQELPVESYLEELDAFMGLEQPSHQDIIPRKLSELRESIELREAIEKGDKRALQRLFDKEDHLERDAVYAREQELLKNELRASTDALLRVKKQLTRANKKVKNSQMPPKDDLSVLVDGCRKKNGSINYSAMSRMLGISDKTAKRWCQEHGIT